MPDREAKVLDLRKEMVIAQCVKLLRMMAAEYAEVFLAKELQELAEQGQYPSNMVKILEDTLKAARRHGVSNRETVA